MYLNFYLNWTYLFFLPNVVRFFYKSIRSCLLLKITRYNKSKNLNSLIVTTKNFVSKLCFSLNRMILKRLITVGKLGEVSFNPLTHLLKQKDYQMWHWLSILKQFLNYIFAHFFEHNKDFFLPHFVILIYIR